MYITEERREKSRVYQREYARKRRQAARGIIEEAVVYKGTDELTLREAGRVIGLSPIIVGNWVRSGRLRSLQYSDIVEFKGVWDKEKAVREKKGIGELNKGREPRIGANLIRVRGKIMERAILLERIYGRRRFIEMMATLYNTTKEEVESILSSRAFVIKRVMADERFLTTNDESTVLQMAKQLSLNPNTKDASLSKLLENIDEMIRQRGSSKVWKLRECGDKADDKLKTFELREE